MYAFESIHAVIQEVSKGSALTLKLSETRLQHEWEKLVGQTIAKHSYPESIRYKKIVSGRRQFHLASTTGVSQNHDSGSDSLNHARLDDHRYCVTHWFRSQEAYR